jgi:surface polysaccharide O-acyltransferase-like enzyme
VSASAGRRCDYDFLRVLSMVGVVYLHTASGALRNTGTALWHFSNLVSSLATAAVPLFFMLSGALLLSSSKTADLGYLFRRRLPKVLIPLLAWSAVVIAATGVLQGSGAALGSLTNLLSTPVVVPYWFLYALIPMYLIAPLLRKMAEGLSNAHWNYLVGLWLVLTIGLATVKDFLPQGSVWVSVFTRHWTLNLDMIGGYLGYFLLGARLERLERLPGRPVLWCAAGVSFAIIALGTWWDAAATGAYNERFKSYLHLFTAVLAVALFLLARSYLQNRRPFRGLGFWAGISFGVYLAHPLAISLWQKLWTAWFGAVDQIWIQIGFYLAILFTCVVAVFVLASIKPLCWVFTGQSFSAACRDTNLFALVRKKD